MKEKDEEMYLPKVNVDKFFTTQEERDEENAEKIIMVETKNLVPFKNHPFKVRDDEELDNLAESIKSIGVKMPLRIRAMENGTYEIVSGHRRLKAGLKAGICELPCIIENMSDEEAVIVMVDSNLQREKILPSERAFAYKMKMEAEKHQGQRNDLTLTTNVSKSRSDEKIGEEIGTSRETIRKYIRLTELIPELLELVDNQYLKIKDKLQMAIAPAVEISYLSSKEQDILLEAMEETLVTPSTPQAKRLREESEKETLTEDKIYEVLDEEKPNQKEQVKVLDEELQPYYPKDIISAEQKRKYVIHCVKRISELEKKQRQREMQEAR